MTPRADSAVGVGTFRSPADPRTAPAAVARSLHLRWRAYMRMGRATRYENWLGTPLWWALLPAPVATNAEAVALVPLTLLGYLALIAAAGTLDDVQGLRDGSDLVNYRRSDPSGLRPLTRKPLLLGWVTEREAIRYAAAALATCVGALVCAWLVAGAHPTWWLPAYGAVLAAGLQYSYGLKLSYIGLQELVLWMVQAASVIFPYLLVTGELPARVAVMGVLFGLWFTQVSMCSNAHDVVGDRQAGRRTIAVLLSWAAYRRVLVGTFVVSWALPVAAVLAGWWPAWSLVALVPTVVLQARQLQLVCQESSPLQARITGFCALRLGSLAVFLGFVVVG